LQANNIRIPKIHYLLEILALILKFDTSYELLRADLDTLEDYAVHFRYPGEFAEKDQAQSAYQAAKVIREFVRQKLGVD
jgi:HEPN domain-containing protein